MLGCCGDHQPPLSAFQGTNTFPGDQPVLVLALAQGLWSVVPLEGAVQLEPRIPRVFSSHFLSQSKLYSLDRVALPRGEALLS